MVETLDIQFEINKLELFNALCHPYVPDFVTEILTPIVLEAELLGTQEFSRYVQ